MKEYCDDSDRLYDAHVDLIICSKDFEECPQKDRDSNCLAVPNGQKDRCWHIHVCPLMKERKDQ